MAQEGMTAKVPLTVPLPAELATRLQAVAMAQNRAATDIVIELLRRHLPSPEQLQPKKGKIPYA